MNDNDLVLPAPIHVRPGVGQSSPHHTAYLDIDVALRNALVRIEQGPGVIQMWQPGPDGVPACVLFKLPGGILVTDDSTLARAVRHLLGTGEFGWPLVTVSGHGVPIGDLAEQLGDASLVRILDLAGIRFLEEIDLVSDDQLLTLRHVGPIRVARLRALPSPAPSGQAGDGTKSLPGNDSCP